jgi:hypothetical protein
MEWFTNLFKDGSWLNNAFSGENLSKTIGAGSSVVDAFSKYQAANATEKFNDKLFNLQETQYNNSLEDQEEEKLRRNSVDNSLASIWG